MKPKDFERMAVVQQSFVARYLELWCRTHNDGFVFSEPTARDGILLWFRWRTGSADVVVPKKNCMSLDSSMQEKDQVVLPATS